MVVAFLMNLLEPPERDDESVRTKANVIVGDGKRKNPSVSCRNFCDKIMFNY